MFSQQRELQSLGRILESHERLPKKSLERLASQRISALRFHLASSRDRFGRVQNPVLSPRSWPAARFVRGLSPAAHVRASLHRLARWHGKGLDGGLHVSDSSKAANSELIRAVERIPSTESWVVAAPADVVVSARARHRRPEVHLWVAISLDWKEYDLPLVRAFGPQGAEFCAIECPRGSAHFQIDRFYPEWCSVDPTTRFQELLVTDLDSRLTPHLRARTGVAWGLSWELCACGVTLPTLVIE